MPWINSTNYDKSIKALNEVMNTDKKIVLVTQKNSEIDDPTEDDIYSYGCEGKILQLLKLPDGTVKVLIEGLNRVKILEFQNNKDFITCKTEIVKEKIDSKEDLLVFAMAILRKLEKLINLNKKIYIESISIISLTINSFFSIFSFHSKTFFAVSGL